MMKNAQAEFVDEMALESLEHVQGFDSSSRNRCSLSVRSNMMYTRHVTSPPHSSHGL